MEARLRIFSMLVEVSDVMAECIGRREIQILSSTTFIQELIRTKWKKLLKFLPLIQRCAKCKLQQIRISAHHDTGTLVASGSDVIFIRT